MFPHRSATLRPSAYARHCINIVETGRRLFAYSPVLFHHNLELVILVLLQSVLVARYDVFFLVRTVRPDASLHVA